MPLQPRQEKAIDLYVLDTFARKQKTYKSYIAEKVGVKSDTVQKWFLRNDEFKERLAQRLAAVKDDFNHLPLAQRATRIERLSEIFEDLEPRRVDLKLKVLKAIQEEVGDHKVQVEVEHKGSVNVNIPPRSSDYDEWLEQNRKMVEADYEVQGGA